MCIFEVKYNMYNVYRHFEITYYLLYHHWRKFRIKYASESNPFDILERKAVRKWFGRYWYVWEKKDLKNRDLTCNKCSDILKRPQKFETISNLIWHLLSKRQIMCEIVSNFVAFLENLNFKTACTRTPNEGINQRNLKIWAYVTNKICFGRT